MSMHKSISARLLATHLVLLGATVGVALAQDADAPASQSDAVANPIDTSITTQPPAHPKRGSKAHSVKKTAIAHASGNSGNHRRNLLHGDKSGVVRNSIGQPVEVTTTGIKATQTLQTSELPKANAVGKTTSPLGTNSLGRSETEEAATASGRQRFVPLRTTAVPPKEPRTNTAMNRSTISGRDMIRPGSGAGAIGGPAKTTVGVITGTGFRPPNP